MPSPRRGGNLGANLGILGNDGVANDHRFKKERGSNRNECPSDQLSLPCGIIRISVRRFVSSFPYP